MPVGHSLKFIMTTDVLWALRKLRNFRSYMQQESKYFKTRNLEVFFLNYKRV